MLENDKIIAVGKVDPTLIAPGAEVIDMEGKYLLTGFVNTHVHTSQQLSRGVGDDIDFITRSYKRMWLTSLIHKGWRLDPTVVPAHDLLRMATK